MPSVSRPEVPADLYMLSELKWHALHAVTVQPLLSRVAVLALA